MHINHVCLRTYIDNIYLLNRTLCLEHSSMVWRTISMFLAGSRKAPAGNWRRPKLIGYFLSMLCYISEKNKRNTAEPSGYVTSKGHLNWTSFLFRFMCGAAHLGTKKPKEQSNYGIRPQIKFYPLTRIITASIFCRSGGYKQKRRSYGFKH